MESTTTTTVERIWEMILDSIPKSLEECCSLRGRGGVLALTAAAAAVAVAWYRLSSKRQRRHNRSYSFTSLASLVGPFPEKAQAAETIINAAMYYDDNDCCPSLADVAEQVVRPMLQYERLAKKPDLSSSRIDACTEAAAAAAAATVVQPRDMIRHFVICGDEQLTQDTINSHLLDSLETGRGDLPWWEFLLIENRGGSGSSVLLLRMHHGLADGLSLVKVFEELLTDEHGKPITSPLLQHSASSALRSRVKPSKWSILRSVVDFLTLPLSRFDDDLPFSRNKYGQKQKRMNHTMQPILLPPVPVDYVKQLKNAAKCSVNDVIMTVMAQAIRDYCLDQQQEQDFPENVQCRALLPVAVPTRDNNNNKHDTKTTALRNSWSMTSIDLCLGVADIEQRLQCIHEKTTAMKYSPLAAVTLWMQNTLLPYLPMAVPRKSLYDTFCRHSLVFSNVPGPTCKCILANQTVSRLQMFYPNLVPQVGLLSYAGHIYGNVILDRSMVPKAERLAQFYAAALVDLGQRLLMKEKDKSSSNCNAMIPQDLIEAAATAGGGSDSYSSTAALAN